jgi:3',5'-cyclic AMP phosphodiesterase CpdA
MTPGNHDASAYPDFAGERAMYARYYARHPPLLAPRTGGNPPFYFAVDVGPLRLLSLDATRPGPLPAEQRRWIEQELVGAADKPVLVFGHLPLQPVSIGRERDIITDPALEALLAQANVTAYLSGHHHAYYAGRRNGVAMISVGNLGGNQRMLVGTRQRTGFSFLLLDLAPGGDLSVEPRLAPDFQQTIHPGALPEVLGQAEQALHRLDTQTAVN